MKGPVRRYREPVAAAFLIALVASIGVHLPVYEGLGRLADHFRAKFAQARQHAISEVEFSVDAARTDADAEPRDKRVERVQSTPKPTPKKRLAVEELQPRPAEQRVIPEQQPDKQAIQQRSQDPDVEPPPDTNYVAQENSRVEEETVARIRNYVKDDPRAQVGAAAQGVQSEEEGNADEQVVADMREQEGSKSRTATPEDTQRKQVKQPVDADPPQSDRVKRAEGASGTARLVTITDASGTYTIAVPQQAGAHGKGRQGPGRDGQVTWSQYEASVGTDAARTSRYARIEERKSKQRGQSRDREWKRFMAAIENFNPTVTPGNQTALNAAASPFANYIATIHRRIHREYADNYLASLPRFAGSPYDDPSLVTKLEIVINRDGSVHRVGVVRTSGLLPFDFGAFNSVLRAQPYPEAPKSILSGDGRVYLHWGFYRNHRQCGTFNAEPYILPYPPGTKRKKNLLQDGPDWGGVVPADAVPTWKTQDEGDSDRDEAPDEKRPKAPAKKPATEDEPAVPAPKPGDAVG